MIDKVECLKRAQVINNICDTLYGKEYKVYLVGSKVRGDDIPESDWDFVIVIPDAENHLKSLRGLIIVDEIRLSMVSRNQGVFNSFSFGGVDYNLSYYDVANDTLVVGPDDAAFVAARTAAKIV